MTTKKTTAATPTTAEMLGATMDAATESARTTVELICGAQRLSGPVASVVLLPLIRQAVELSQKLEELRSAMAEERDTQQP